MVQRLALPFAVGASGGLVSLPQDSPAEIAQSVALLLFTPVGDRRCVPDYGLEDPIFGGIDLDAVTETIAEWEDRADPAQVELVLDGFVDGASEQDVTVYPADPAATAEES